MARKKKQGAVTGATNKSVAARTSQAATPSRLDQDSENTSACTVQPIVATITPGDTGPQVANLQDALFVLLERKIIRPLDPPNRPTREELKELSEGLKPEREQSLFGKATQQLVIYFQVQHALGETPRDVGVEEKTAAKLNALLKSIGALDNPDSHSFVVRGTVKSADGQPLSGALVHAFDRDLRKRQPLGEAETDGRGQYIIRYGSSQFAAGEVSSAIGPSLIVRAFAGDQQIGKDVTRPKSEHDEVIDFTVPPSALSEWETLFAGIIPLLKGQGEGDRTLPPWELNDGDLKFIAQETGLETEQIRLWALAFAVGRDAAVDMQPAGVISASGAPTHALPDPVVVDGLSTFAIFYGWFRQGLPTDWEALRLQRISTLREALLDAIDQNIIAARFREDVEDILARVPNPQLRELATVLRGAILSQEKLRAVLTQVDAVEAVSDEVLTRLVEQKALAEQEAERVGLNVWLHRLAGGDQSIVSTMLDSQFASVKTGKLQHARDLASLEPEDWESALENAGSSAPQGVSRSEYARSLAMEAAGEFPQAAFVQRATRVPSGIDDKLNKIRPLLENNKEAIAHDFAELNLEGMSNGDRESLREVHADLKRFANLHPGLGLHEVFSTQGGAARAVALAGERIGWLRTVFELNPEVSFLSLDYLPDSADLKEIKFGSVPTEGRAPVLANLKAYQRIQSVTNNPIPTLEIMQAGFHSASAIALARAPDFAEKTGLPEAEARAYYDAAREVANAAALQWFKLYEVARDKTTTPIRVIPSANEFFEPLTDFAELIKSQPWCECAHCQSVLSPAAYFVDLMYYIEQSSVRGQARCHRRPHVVAPKARLYL